MLSFFPSFISFFFHSNKYILPLFFWLHLFILILFSCWRLLFYILLLILKHFWPLSHIPANVRETHLLPTLKSICRHFGKKMTTPRQQIIKRENSMPGIKNSYVPFKDKDNKNKIKETVKVGKGEWHQPSLHNCFDWIVSQILLSSRVTNYRPCGANFGQW